LNISQLSGIIVNNDTFKANKQLFIQKISDSLIQMTESSQSTTSLIQVFLFKKEYSNKLRQLLSGEISIFYQELMNAYNIFQLLNGETVKALITQEQILKHEIDFLKKITDTRNREFESSAKSNSRVNTLRPLLLDYIYGKKTAIIKEGLAKASSVFHVPKSALDNIEQLNRNAKEGKNRFETILEATTSYITDKEKSNADKRKRIKQNSNIPSTETQDKKRGKFIGQISSLDRLIKKGEKDLQTKMNDPTKQPTKAQIALSKKISENRTKKENIEKQLKELDIIKKLPLNSYLVRDFLRPFQEPKPFLREGGSKKRKNSQTI
jgi:hypothetical protein